MFLNQLNPSNSTFVFSDDLLLNQGLKVFVNRSQRRDPNCFGNLRKSRGVTVLLDELSEKIYYLPLSSIKCYCHIFSITKQYPKVSIGSFALSSSSC